MIGYAASTRRLSSTTHGAIIRGRCRLVLLLLLQVVLLLLLLFPRAVVVARLVGFSCLCLMTWTANGCPRRLQKFKGSAESRGQCKQCLFNVSRRSYEKLKFCKSLPMLRRGDIFGSSSNMKEFLTTRLNSANRFWWIVTIHAYLPESFEEIILVFVLFSWRG